MPDPATATARRPDLTVTIDHDVVGGAPATRFAADLRRVMHRGGRLASVADDCERGRPTAAGEAPR
jgi:hypothetical protein